MLQNAASAFPQPPVLRTCPFPTAGNAAWPFSGRSNLRHQPCPRTPICGTKTRAFQFRRAGRFPLSRFVSTTQVNRRFPAGWIRQKEYPGKPPITCRFCAREPPLEQQNCPRRRGSAYRVLTRRRYCERFAISQLTIMLSRRVHRYRIYRHDRQHGGLVRASCNLSLATRQLPRKITWVHDRQTVL
jgi:hypothetical protein